jgi:heme/copper-type cytochrome/quinol oxidase subunit 2
MRESRARSARWWLVASVLAVALAACGGGGDDNRSAAATTAGPATTAAASATTTGGSATTTTGAAGAQTVQIAVTGTKVQTAERRVKVPLDGKVRLEVTADRADEVHLHGYDRKVDISPGKPAVLEFTADVPGVFEVELEEAGLKLVELQVS